MFAKSSKTPGSILCLIVCLLWLPGCSDFGSGSDEGWIRYDLPGGHIMLPPELTPRTTVAAAPENPEFSGVVDGHALKVQFCLNSPLAGPQFGSYNETAIMENGCRIVLFNAFGMFHMYDSHFSSMIGAKAFLEPGANPVMVVVAVQDAGADAISYAILQTLHP
jgi:hypothetical protein